MMSITSRIAFEIASHLQRPLRADDLEIIDETVRLYAVEIERAKQQEIEDQQELKPN